MDLASFAQMLDSWESYLLLKNAAKSGNDEVKSGSASKLEMLTHIKREREFIAKASLPYDDKEESDKYSFVAPLPQFLPEPLLGKKKRQLMLMTKKSGLPVQTFLGWDSTFQLVSGKQFWYFQPCLLYTSPSPRD